MPQVTSIGNSAFSNCTSLAKIKIPNSVTSIGSSVFSNCTNLTDIYCPENTSKPKDWAEHWKVGCSAAVHWDTSMPTE